MGNLCNCFVPKNVDEDYDFEKHMKGSAMCKKELRRGGGGRGYAQLGNDYVEITSCGGVVGVGGNSTARRHSCETCYSQDEIFTISSSRLPSPVAYRECLLQGSYGGDNHSSSRGVTPSSSAAAARALAHSSLLESIEQFYTMSSGSEKQRQATRNIWSLRPDSFMLHSHPASSSSCLTSPCHVRVEFISERESGVSSASSTESLLLRSDDKKCNQLSSLMVAEDERSFDSGFGGATATTTATTSAIIDMSSFSSPFAVPALIPSPSPIKCSSNYLVVEQTSNKPRSLFRYLFDVSHMIRDALFEWPAMYVRKIKQNLSTPAATCRRQVTWRPKKYDKMSYDVDDVESACNTSTSNLIDKPMGIMGLLSKLNLFRLVESFNLFNLFRPTVTAAAAAATTTKSTISSSPYGFNPLRDFFLRLFDINFL